MNIIFLVVAAGAALVLLGGRRQDADPATVSLTGFAGPTSQALPIRVPAAITSQPPSNTGAEREDEDGRAWGTFYVNRDKRKHHELRVFRVAEDAGNAAIGNGEVIADVYQTVVASAGWQWNGQACGALRFRLTFRQGRLVGQPALVTTASPDKPLPSCYTVRPINEVFRRKIAWVQRGPDIYLVMDTESGLNKRNDSIAGGVGSIYSGNANSQWDNDYVASGDVVVDVSWIFNPADANGNPQ